MTKCKPITIDDAKQFIQNGLLAAYALTGADRTMIETACNRIYQLGREKGLNEAYEAINKDMRLPERERGDYVTLDNP